MGKKLIIQGADFSAHPVNAETNGVAIPNNTMISVVNGTAGYWGLGQYQANRLSIVGVNSLPIKIPKGCSITLSGLKGNGSQTALWLDWAMYDSPIIPAYPQASTTYVSGNAPNLIETASNFVSANYFPLNHSNGTSITVSNTKGKDVWIVFVAKGGSAGSNISASTYNTYLKFTISENP